MIKSVVVTGASSSIGTAIIDECIKENIRVLAIVKPDSVNFNRINRAENVTVLECSLEELNSIETDEKYEAFIHLAWAATAGDAARNLLIPQSMNIRYALEAVDLAKKLGCSVFVGSGSQAEYGRTDEILTESTAPNPETAYGMAKLCAGQMTRLSCSQKGIRHIWPRILSAYGPKCQTQSVINYILNELINDRIPSLSGGDQVWDFIYTGDVARALLLLADKGHDGEVYVIGSGKQRLLKEYFVEAAEVVKEKLGKKEASLGLGEKPYGPNTVMHLACNIDKLKKDVGFEINTDFSTGISNTIEWLLNS